MPHILPCPAPRAEFADVEVTEDGRRRRRRWRPAGDAEADTTEDKLDEYDVVNERAIMEKRAHQCPVPKPSGVIGKALGFGRDRNEK